MIDISKIKVESERVDYLKFKHVASLKIHGVMYCKDDPQCHIAASKEAKVRLWREVYGDLDELVRAVYIDGFKLARQCGPEHRETIDNLRYSIEALAKRIQYPDENTTPLPPRPV